MGFEEGIKRYLNKENLKKIRSFKTGIAGAGGLGSNCAMLLARSGFSDFVIADFDNVDDSNLNRQFFFKNQTGMKKTEALKENLLKINDNIKIKLFEDELSCDTLNSVFKDCSILIEAFDNPEMKKLFVENFFNSGKFVVASSGVSGFNMYNRIRVKKIKENLYIVGDGYTEVSDDNPPLAPSVMTAASMQADIVLSYSLGKLKDEIK